MKGKLAIVGGGISGILATKLAKENNFEVTLFEQKGELLGNWNMNSQIWSHLTTNISKYYTQFSDFVWNDTANIFANKKELNIFINNYLETFGVVKFAKTNTRVIKVLLSDDKKFKIQSINLLTGTTEIEIFDYVIVSSGSYSIPYIPNVFKDITNSSEKQIEVIHSKDYQGPERFKGRRVMVVGNGHSGVEISSEVCKSSNSLINTFIEKACVMPKFIFSKDYDRILPYDLASLSRSKLQKMKVATREVIDKNRNLVYNNITQQNEAHEALFIHPEETKTYPISVSSHYVEDVKKGLITPVLGRIQSVDGKIVTMSDGTKYEIDTLILSTGFMRDYSYLDEKILKIIGFDKNTHQCSNLEYNLFPTELNIGFMAISRGTLCIWELEALVIILQFMGKLKDNSFYSTNEKHLLDVPLIRYDFLAGLAGLQPPLDRLEENDPELYDMILNGPLLPQHYYLNHPKLYKFNSEYIKKVNTDLRRKNLIPKF